VFAPPAVLPSAAAPHGTPARPHAWPQVYLPLESKVSAYAQLEAAALAEGLRAAQPAAAAPGEAAEDSGASVAALAGSVRPAFAVLHAAQERCAPGGCCSLLARLHGTQAPRLARCSDRRPCVCATVSRATPTVHAQFAPSLHAFQDSSASLIATVSFRSLSSCMALTGGSEVKGLLSAVDAALAGYLSGLTGSVTQLAAAHRARVAAAGGGGGSAEEGEDVANVLQLIKARRGGGRGEAVAAPCNRWQVCAVCRQSPFRGPGRTVPALRPPPPPPSTRATHGHPALSTDRSPAPHLPRRPWPQVSREVTASVSRLEGSLRTALAAAVGRLTALAAAAAPPAASPFAEGGAGEGAAAAAAGTAAASKPGAGAAADAADPLTLRLLAGGERGGRKARKPARWMGRGGGWHTGDCYCYCYCS
jgi:hypothetical protein